MTGLMDRTAALEQRIAELEATVAAQAETIASLRRLLDDVAVVVRGSLRIFADLPEMRERGGVTE